MRFHTFAELPQVLPQTPPTAAQDKKNVVPGTLLWTGRLDRLLLLVISH